MIEKRIIEGREYWVNVEVGSDGSVMETIIGAKDQAMKDKAELQARAMQEVLNAQLEQQKRDQDYYEGRMRVEQAEQELRMQDEIIRQNALLEEQRKLNAYNVEYDDIRNCPNGYDLLTEEQKYAFKYYIKYVCDYCTKKDLHDFMQDTWWKLNKDDFIKEEEAKRDKEWKEFLKKQEDEKLEAKKQEEIHIANFEAQGKKASKKKLWITLGIIGGIVLTILFFWGISMDTTSLF